MRIVKKLFNDFFTGDDNKTYDMSVFLLFMGCCFFLFLSTLDVIYTKHFEYEHFGIGLASILAGGGLGYKFRK